MILTIIFKIIINWKKNLEIKIRSSDTNQIFDILFNIRNRIHHIGESCSRPRLYKFQPSEGLASRLLKMTSFTFPDIFKRFSNVKLRTTRGSTSFFSRLWIIARFFTTFSRNGDSKPPWEKWPRIFHCFFPRVIYRSICRGLH